MTGPIQDESTSSNNIRIMAKSIIDAIKGVISKLLMQHISDNFLLAALIGLV